MESASNQELIISDDEFMATAITIYEGLQVFFNDKLQNIVLVVEDEPTPELLASLSIKDGQKLLGLYQGYPYVNRGVGYSLVSPDKIVLYKTNILNRAKNQEQVFKLIKKVLIHEIGHYLGLSEHQLLELEVKNRVRF